MIFLPILGVVLFPDKTHLEEKIKFNTMLQNTLTVKR